MRSFWINACNIVYWIALTIWIAMIVSAGVAAGGVFSTLPKLGITIERFAAYDHTRHGMLAAGMVMEPIFTFIDLIQIIAAIILIAMLVTQLIFIRLLGRRWSNGIRVLCIAAAAALLAYRVTAITPSMNRELRAYWSAAEAGKNDEAEAHRLAFDHNHPVVSSMYRITLTLLLITTAASAVALGPTPQRQPKPLLQTPALRKHS